MPSRYLNQCWLITIWAIGNDNDKFQSQLNQNTKNHWGKWVWKCCVRNFDHFVGASTWCTIYLVSDITCTVTATNPTTPLSVLPTAVLPSGGSTQGQRCLNMMTSSNGNIFRVTGHLCGEFTGPGEFPTQRSVTRSFDVIFDLCLNKRLNKQPWYWWFETPSCSLWCQCNEKSKSW